MEFVLNLEAQDISHMTEEEFQLALDRSTQLLDHKADADTI
jgi:hypothetical protein